MERDSFPRAHRPRRAPHCLAVALVALLAAGSAHALVHPAALQSEHDPGASDGDIAAQIDCVALNVYHEARSEPAEAKFQIALVTLNRVRDHRFPNTACRVVWQRGQFSWTKDGRPDRPYNPEAWADAVWIATLAWWHSGDDMAGEAIYFHSVDVQPGWARKMRRLRTVGRHVFYAAQS